MGFSGFEDSDGKFFKRLAKNQNREWFAKHKAEYEEQWQSPMLELLQSVSAGIDASYEYCELEAPKVFRIYRDVRFGKDKSPFKTSISGVLSIAGKNGVMDKPVALYLQLGSEALAAAGHWMMPPEQLVRFRDALVDDKKGHELDRILASLQKRGHTLSAAESLKKVPKGFDPNHPRAELLKRKGMVAQFPKMPAIDSAAFAKWLIAECKAVEALVTWTTYATS